ncbi:MAG: DUF3850 domain-containing protein [Gammaproteobacteria bacterium]|nr:DUF3850 domain-containing protein [Gammaproteobacteria bacterium]
MSKKHELKIIQPYFSDVSIGRKKFELRNNDRDFEKGDILKLREWDGEQFTGNFIIRKISYVLQNIEGLKKGFCVLGIV